MHPLMLIPAVLCLAACGVPLANAAGTGTFILSDATALVGQNGMTTLALNASWEPPASDIWLNVRYDPAIIRYEGTRFTAGGTGSATRTQAGTVLVQLIDTAGVYRTGPLATITFSGLKNGSSPGAIHGPGLRSSERDGPHHRDAEPDHRGHALPDGNSDRAAVPPDTPADCRHSVVATDHGLLRR